MKTYSSNTYYLFDKIAFLLMFAGLSGGIAYFLRDIKIVQISGLTLAALLLFLVVLMTRKIAKIEFDHSKIVVNYRFTGKEVKIDYSSITEIKHITAYNLTGLNIIKYRSQTDLKDEKLKITTVVSDIEYIDFIKWLKRKNDKIIYIFLPSDSALKKEYLKEFEK